MANKRKKKRAGSSRIAINPADRYELAIKNGRELSAVLSGKSAPRGFPKKSVGYFLRTRRSGSLDDIYNYYSRKDIQQAMYRYAAGRKITYLRLFRPQYNRLRNSEDILPLALSTFLESGRYWPSLHGTVSRYGIAGGRICDVIIEIDYKSSWKKCFEMTRPIVDMLQSRGAIFRLKFSGHCSVHIILPAEMLRVGGFPVEHSRFFRCLSEMVKKKLKEPRYLDTSFHMYDHFLRLAYSVNENTGLVSLPFDVSGYDRFDPSKAEPKNVSPIHNWWSFPKNAPARMQEFIKFVMRGQIALSPKAVSIQTIEVPEEGKWQVDRKIVRQARMRKRQAAREFLPNEGFYDRMLRIGQDIIDLRDFLLLEDRDSKIALRTLKHHHRTGQPINLSSIAGKFNVDEEDLALLWKWDMMEREFRYYARDDIKQAIYAHAERRKIRVGNEDKLVFLQEPADVLPLIVYAHLSSARAQDKYPAIYFSNSKYERTGKIPIACDLKIEFSTKNDDENILEAATPVLSLLSGFKITFFLLFDGVRAPSVMIPYEAFPKVGKLASIRHDNTLSQLAPHLKRSMRMPGATCRIIKDPHALSLMPYSIHPQTGLACVPVKFSDLRFFSERDAWLGEVQVDNEWWDIPEDAAGVTVSFLKQMAPLVGF